MGEYNNYLIVHLHSIVVLSFDFVLFIIAADTLSDTFVVILFLRYSLFVYFAYPYRFYDYILYLDGLIFW